MNIGDMVKSIGSPWVRPLCDYYHVRAEGEDPGQELEKSGELPVHTHIAKLRGREWFTDISVEENYIFRYADRSYPASEWKQINGAWYYFNTDGYMVTGWFQSPASGYWYYLDPDSGRMATNQYIGSYYVNADGVWVQ